MVQSKAQAQWRVLEIKGGRVEVGDSTLFRLPPTGAGYADAQIDDYGQPGGRFEWLEGATLHLRARFSHDTGVLRGTAGFGFWNAPYGDPTRRWPALPRAAWFFYGSDPNDLPFGPSSPGRGWFAATIDAGTPEALALIPLAPAVLAFNQLAAVQRHLWPTVRQRLGIHAAAIDADMTQFHDYHIDWRADGVNFTVDGRTILNATTGPRGPLGFVCWIDNQFLVMTPRGRFRAGVLPTTREQWLEVAGLRLGAIDTNRSSP